MVDLAVLKSGQGSTSDENLVEFKAAKRQKTVSFLSKKEKQETDLGGMHLRESLRCIDDI